MQIDTTWRAARDQLVAAAYDTATLDAQVLLIHVLGVEDRAYLLAHPEQTLTDAQQSQYNTLIARRLTGEPIAYIRGFRAWYDRDMLVTPDVLIPRPETELLLEAALKVVRERQTVTVADICTGSGAIAVTLKANAPHATVYATDISTAALAVAGRNAQHHQVELTLLHGDLLAPLLSANVKVDVLLSNPPYIATDALVTLEVSKHEPLLALDGGSDGLDLVRRLLIDAPRVCHPGAWVGVEIGSDQGGAVLALAQQYLHPVHVEIRQDYAGLDRFLWAQLTS